MDDMIQQSLEGFDSLWRRVSCPEDAPPRAAGMLSQEDALLGLIHDETCAAASAEVLARMFQGAARTTLLRHAAEARRHLRRLRAEYFIATGVPGGTNEDCRAPGGRLSALRSALLQAGDMADRYAAAAERTDCPALGEALAAFAADERRRAGELRSLVIGSF